MPPKKKDTVSLSQPKTTSKSTPKNSQAQIQTKLTSSEVTQKSGVIKKTKSKQFSPSGETLSAPSVDNTKLWKYGSGVTPNKLHIGSWNVNGIRAVIGRGEINKYIDAVKLDILCIGETKVDYQAYKKNQIVLPAGYNAYWNFCKCSAGYSGVAIFSKYLPLSLVEDLPQKEHSQQGRVLTMQFEKFYLITAYIPNAGQKLDRLKYRVGEWDKAFQDYCQGLKKKKTVIVCGDLNVAHQEIDIANPLTNTKTAGFTQEERDSFTKWLSLGWVDTFRKLHPEQVKYSWWSMRTNARATNKGWRLDYFIVNQQGLGIVSESTINNDIYGSDHCPVQLRITL